MDPHRWRLKKFGEEGETQAPVEMTQEERFLWAFEKSAQALTRLSSRDEKLASAQETQRVLCDERTARCMESKDLCQTRIDAMVKAWKEREKAWEKEKNDYLQRIDTIIKYAPKQPKWIWAFRELTRIAEKRPWPFAVVTMLSILVVLTALLFGDDIGKITGLLSG